MTEFYRYANATKETKKENKKGRRGGSHKEIGRRRQKGQVEVSAQLNTARFSNERMRSWFQISYMKQ
jgi:hypothetical protein